MKTKYGAAEALAGKTFMDLEEVWESSTKLSNSKYGYTRQHGSRAAKWLPLAISDAQLEPGIPVDEIMLNETRLSLPLDRILLLHPDQLAPKARAMFLIGVHSIQVDTANAAGPNQELSAKIKKTANNVKESTARAIRFFQEMFVSHYGLDDDGTWPIATKEKRFAHGMILYRAIQRKHVQEGILDPLDASPRIALKGAQYYIDRANSRRNAGAYSTMKKQLGKALDCGLLKPLQRSLLEDLPTLKYNTWQGEKASLSRAELVKLWPEHFSLDPARPNRLDYNYGLLGFYNKECRSSRPTNPEGEKCPSANLLGEISVFKREEAVRRYLYRARTDESTEAPKPLHEYFSAGMLISWMDKFLDDSTAITTHHKSEHLDIAYIATKYFGADLQDYEKWLEDEGIDFPESGECMRGSEAVKIAGSPKVFLRWADAFGQYADAVQRLSERKQSGYYLPRKSLQIDTLLRCETGLRPGNINPIEYLLTIPDDRAVHSCPTLWRRPDGTYMLAVPYRCMKQHKKRLNGQGRCKTKRRCYEFPIQLAETVRALDEYLEFGWQHAAAVRNGRTRRLFLSRKGEPLPTLQGTFQSMRPIVANNYKKGTGITLPLLDRYAARHVIGEFLNRYMPAGQLKAWYLTHRSGVGSDNSYGNDDARFLRECVKAVLYGIPSLPEQQRLRDEEAQKQAQAQTARLQALVEQSAESTNQINRLLKIIEGKEEEIRNLRGKAAKKNAARPGQQD